MLDRINLSRFNNIVQTAHNQLPQLSDVESTQSHLDAAIRWLYKSQDITEAGGSSAGYTLVFGWKDQYPETTGYIIPTLYRYASKNDSAEAQTRATEMAEWLLSVQLPNGSFPGLTGSSGPPRVFNTGQVLFGLTAAYQETQRDDFKQAAIDAAEWLIQVQDSDGSWNSYTYNQKPHAYHTRVAWSLLEVYAIHADEAYVEAARKNYEWAIDQQRANGWFEKNAFKTGDSPFLHTIAYTARGLIEGGIILDDAEIFEAGKETADTLRGLQEINGVLKGEYDFRWDGTWYHCLPGNAQMANIWVRLYDHTGETRYLTSASHTVQFLKRHQVMGGESDIRGGIAGSYPVIGRYMFLRYPNWGVKFLADAFLSLNEAKSTKDTVNTTESTDDECRVCILFNGEYTTQWVAESIEKMLEETSAEISLVVINDDSGFLSSGNLKRGMKYPAYYTFQVGELVSDKIMGMPEYRKPVHISDIKGVDTASKTRTYPAETDGLWNELPDDVIEEIARTSDIVFRRGFGLIQGDILDATQFGVLSYHHGDPRKYRGGPAGFWEYMYDEQRVGAIVQSLTDELDAGIVQAYDEVNIENCQNWEEVKEEIYTSSTNLLAKAVETVQDDRTSAEVVDDLGPVYHPPSAVDLGRYFWKQLR